MGAKYIDGSEDFLIKFFAGQPDQETIRKTAQKYQQNWPVFYHLTPQRQGLLSWWRLTAKSGTILEVGAGGGSLTGQLADKAKQLTVLEPSLKRFRILQERYGGQKQKKIKLVAQCLEDYDQDTAKKVKFDAIAMIGVLEYAGRDENGLMEAEWKINKSKNKKQDRDESKEAGQDENELRNIRQSKNRSAAQHWLKIAAKRLKSQGQLVLAIENRLGLKYFNGCREDHDNRYFSSLENYARSSASAQTYSLAEIKNLLNRAGLEIETIYCPFPDYKLPQVIVRGDFFQKKKIASNS